MKSPSRGIVGFGDFGNQFARLKIVPDPDPRIASQLILRNAALFPPGTSGSYPPPFIECRLPETSWACIPLHELINSGGQSEIWLCDR